MEIKLDAKSMEILNGILKTLNDILLEEKTQTRMTEEFFADLNKLETGKNDT